MESSFKCWKRSDFDSALINTLDWLGPMQVMEKWWTMTALAQPSLEELVRIASNLTQTLYQCLRTLGQFECDWGTQWTWHWRRRPIGSHGSMTHYRGVYGLCFLHLIQHRPLKALIGVQMCPFSSICFVCSYRVAKISSCQISHSSRLEVCSAVTGNITLVMGELARWRYQRFVTASLCPGDAQDAHRHQTGAWCFNEPPVLYGMSSC